MTISQAALAMVCVISVTHSTALNVCVCVWVAPDVPQLAGSGDEDLCSRLSKASISNPSSTPSSLSTHSMLPACADLGVFHVSHESRKITFKALKPVQKLILSPCGYGHR